MTVYAGYAQAGSYPAAIDRYTVGAALNGAAGASIARRAGVLPSAAQLAVTAPGGMNVRVAVGQAVIPGGYILTNDALLTVAVQAAGSSARTDLVVARMYDAEAGDGSTGAAIEVIKGTTTAVPTTPARALPLATIAVGASVSAISAANLTDVRTWTAASGALLYVPGALASSPTSDLTPGQAVWDPTAGQMAIVNAAGGWAKSANDITAVASISAGPAAATWSMADTTWTQAAGMTQDFAIGSDVTTAANTIRVNAGIWLVTGIVEWGVGGTGIRYCGIGFASADVRQWSSTPVATGIRPRASVSTHLQVTAANTAICLYGAQNSGATITNAAARSLTVQRVA